MAGSYLSIAIEVVAMIAYDGIGVFNLTVFEIVAFTLVFAWLIALVAMTHTTPETSGCRDRSPPRPRPRRARGTPSPERSSTRQRAGLLVGLRPDGLTHAFRVRRRAPRRSTTSDARCGGAGTEPTIRPTPWRSA